MNVRRAAILLLPVLLLSACSGGSPALESPPERKRVNDYPIVLVYGLLGFGRDELFGFKYWGGFIDLEQELREGGYETYTSAVGPVSSVWDRACELYACIKGVGSITGKPTRSSSGTLATAGAIRGFTRSGERWIRIPARSGRSISSLIAWAGLPGGFWSSFWSRVLLFPGRGITPCFKETNPG
jgi:hypothetical protein